MSSYGSTLTRFERAKLLSSRAEQISNNDPPLVPVDEGVYDALEIAKKELEAGVLPLNVRRYYPDGRIEIISSRGEVIETSEI